MWIPGTAESKVRRENKHIRSVLITFQLIKKTHLRAIAAGKINPRQTVAVAPVN